MALVSIRQKGQVSIEFILIITLVLVYIHMYVWPTIDISAETATAIKAVADTKVSSLKLANALNEAAVSSGDMKKTINLFLPERAEITCNTADNRIDYDVFLSKQGFNPLEKENDDDPDEPGCVEEEIEGVQFYKCSSYVEMLSSVAGPLQAGSGTCPNIESLGNSLFTQLVVEKRNSEIYVDLE